MNYNINYSCVSHIGKIRKMNQDNFICNGDCMEVCSQGLAEPLSGSVTSGKPSLFGVFDGMGGEECGEMASYIAAKEAQFIKNGHDAASLLSEYCINANEKICDYADENFITAMGTTAAMLMFFKNEITLCNIGDSKVFRSSDGSFEQISQDHILTTVSGRKPPLTQNLGIPPVLLQIQPYLAQGECRDGDRYLICSDGLTDMVSCEEISEQMNENTVENATQNLLDRALENGGRDNITIILLEISQIKNSLLNVFKR